MAAGLPVHYADYLVRLGLIELGTELVEDAQGGFGILLGLVVPLTGHVYLSVIQKAQAPEVHIANRFRDLQTAPEIPVGVIPQLPVDAHNAKVLVGARAPPIIAYALEGLQGALVVGQRLGQRALNVGENSQILLGPAS